LEYYEKHYDDIIVYEAEKKPHYKRAITERNRFMIDMADLVIAYVDKQDGGAYQATRYAQHQSKELVVLRGKVNHH
jgi:predicted Rossmann fold nucleotide-binding protein DprA/Smf involved in DNA uptake